MFLLLCIPIHTMTSDGMFSTFCPNYEIITFFQGVLGTHSFSFLMLSNFCLITLNSISLTNFNNKCNVWPILTLFLNSLNFTLISSFIHTFWSLYHAFNHDNFRGGGILKFCYNTKCPCPFEVNWYIGHGKCFLTPICFLSNCSFFSKFECILSGRWVSVVEFHDRALGIGKVFGQESTAVEWNYQILGFHEVTVHQKLDVILVIKWFKKWSQQKMLFAKQVRLNWYSSMKFFLERFGWFLT